MSSVDWSKNKGNDLTKNLRHAARHNRKNVTYENHDIDETLRDFNYTVGGDGSWNDWRGEADKLRKRVAEIDAIKPPKRVRKDRVTSVSYVIALPKGLVNSGREKEFFEMAYNTLAEFSGGKENLTVGYVHFDEVHEYYDNVKRKNTWSRGHMHVSGIPYTKEHGVNGKNFQTKARMVELNDLINERCLKLFKTPFYDWDLMAYERKRNGEFGRDMDNLKHESRKALAEEMYELTNKVDDKRQELIALKDKEKEASEKLSKVTEELSDKESQLWHYKHIEHENKRLKQRLGVFERVFAFLKEVKLFDKFLSVLSKHDQGRLKADLIREVEPTPQKRDIKAIDGFDR